MLVHAEVPEELPWWALKAWLEEGDRRAGILALWARERIMNDPRHDRGVPDVWRTFHGHVPLRELRQVGNMRWIDAGAAYAHAYDGAAVACVPIGPDGCEHDPGAGQSAGRGPPASQVQQVVKLVNSRGVPGGDAVAFCT